MEVAIFLGILVALVIGVIISLEFSNIAADKGYVGDKYFWYPFLFGIFGMLIVVALPDRGTKALNVIALGEKQAAPTPDDEEIPDL